MLGRPKKGGNFAASGTVLHRIIISSYHQYQTFYLFIRYLFQPFPTRPCRVASGTVLFHILLLCYDYIFIWFMIYVFIVCHLFEPSPTGRCSRTAGRSSEGRCTTSPLRPLFGLVFFNKLHFLMDWGATLASRFFLIKFIRRVDGFTSRIINS